MSKGPTASDVMLMGLGRLGACGRVACAAWGAGEHWASGPCAVRPRDRTRVGHSFIHIIVSTVHILFLIIDTRGLFTNTRGV